MLKIEIEDYNYVVVAYVDGREPIKWYVDDEQHAKDLLQDLVDICYQWKIEGDI